MTVPFRVDPESVRRQAPQDPFLEFESERPSRGLLGEKQKRDESERTDADEDDRQSLPSLGSLSSDSVTSERRETSAISPSVAFAVGVAGLVTAAVGYYQMGQLLADRSQLPAATATAPVASSVPPPASTVPPLTGRLEIASDPSGATVKVDGTDLGVTPLTLPEYKPGNHEIVLTRGKATVTRTVELTAGGSALVTAVLAAAAPATAAAAPRAAAVPANAGWVTFDSPIELRVLSRGQPAGSTRGRVALGPGAYQFELVSDLYEIRQVISARVAAGQGTSLAVQLPTGLLSVNALPWADVWVDGSPVGTTPLGNLNLKVGTHQVVLRHPTLGERQQTVIVKAVTPARLGVTFSR